MRRQYQARERESHGGAPPTPTPQDERESRKRGPDSRNEQCAVEAMRRAALNVERFERCVGRSNGIRAGRGRTGRDQHRRRSQRARPPSIELSGFSPEQRTQEDHHHPQERQRRPDMLGKFVRCTGVVVTCGECPAARVLSTGFSGCEHALCTPTEHRTCRAPQPQNAGVLPTSSEHVFLKLIQLTRMG